MKIMCAIALLTFAANAMAAEPAVNIAPGASVKCDPFPSIKKLNGSLFEQGKLVGAGLVTCFVTDNQPLPKGTKLVAKQVDGPVANSYSLSWTALQLQDGYVVQLDNDLIATRPAGPDYPGHIVLTFHRGLDVGLSAQEAEEK